MGFEGMEGSPALTPATEDELQLASDLIFKYLDEENFLFVPSLLVPSSSLMSPDSLLVPPSPESPESTPVPSSSPASPASPESLLVQRSSCSPVFPSSLTLPPPLLEPASSSTLSPLIPASPSAHPQLAPSVHFVSPRVFQSPALPWREDPLSLPPASESQTPPRPIGSTLAPCSLVSTVACHPTSSTGLPCPSLVSCRPSSTKGFHSSGFTLSLHPSGSSFPPAPPLSLVALASLQSSGSPPLPQAHEPSSLLWPSRPAVSPWLTVCSALLYSLSGLVNLFFHVDVDLPLLFILDH